MLSTGMPELQKPEDIQYIVTKLNLDKTDEQAGDIFEALIEESRTTTRMQIMDFFHLMAH